MPVRGHGWYKRPYRIRITSPSGHVQTRCFHWKGARDKEAERDRSFGFTVEVWDEPVDPVQVRD